MALNSYNKNIKLNIDLLGFNTAEKKLKKLEKDLNDLRDKRIKLDEEKAKLEKSAEKEKYERAKKEYEEQRKLLGELKAIKKADRTEEQNKQIKQLEASTKQYSEEEARRNSLYEFYKTYGSSEKTKEFDELFSIMHRLEELSQDELELNQEALGIRAQQREAKKNAKSLKDLSKESFKNLTTGIKDKLKESFNDFIKGFNEKLKDTFENAIKEYKNVASYSLSTSLKMNREAREQALTYGLSDAQNYALTKAMDEIGASSVEDLYWMTPAQQERFSERIGYWTGQYNSLADKDAFKTLEELQAEITDIKTDFQMEVVQFISNNKETIISAMKIGVSVLQKIMDLVAWLVGDTVKSEQASAVSDAINNYSNSSNSTTSVKIDNSFNGVGTDNLAKLRKAGNEVNRQIIKALS